MNQEHVDIVLAGKEAIDNWRRKHPKERLNLVEASFRGIKLNRADLTDALLSNSHFVDVELSKVNFSGANLTLATFEGCILRNAIFPKNDSLGKRPIEEIVLDETSFTNCDLTEADFSDSVMKCVNLNSAICCKTDFSNAQLSYPETNWTDFKEAIFNNAVLLEVDLSGKILTNVSFRGASLDDVKFYNSELCNADFTDATLIDVCLTSSKLQGATLDGIKFGPVEIHTWKIDRVQCSHFFVKAVDKFGKPYWVRVPEENSLPKNDFENRLKKYKSIHDAYRPELARHKIDLQVRLPFEPVRGDADDEPEIETGKRKKRGRKKDPEIVARNIKMAQEWESGGYSTWPELGKAYNITAAAARMAMNRISAKKPRKQKL